MSLVVSHDDTYGCMDWDSNTVVTANGLHKNDSMLVTGLLIISSLPEGKKVEFSSS